MPVDKSVIKAQFAGSAAFDYQAREISVQVSAAAKEFVSGEQFTSKDFKIADLVAQQAGISQLETDLRQDKINAQVLDSMKEIEETAYQEGYELGRTEGAERAFNEAKQEFIGKISALEAVMGEVEKFKLHLLKENEAEFINLVFLIAKKIAMRDLSENREAVLKILESVAGEMQSDQQVIVEVAPKDLEFLNQFQEKSGRKLESLERVKLQPNEGLMTGGCVVKTEYGSVNATVEERIERVWQALESRIPQSGESSN